MSLALTAALVRRFLAMTPAEQRALIIEMTPEDQLAFDADFEMWAHNGQIAPDGEGWRVWLMMAGRGYGKTRAGAEWVMRLASQRKVRFALVGATIDDARAVMIEGVSGLLSVARHKRARVKWEPSLGRLTWPQGSVATLFSGDNPDGLRGPEHHFAWADELAKWRQAEAAPPTTPTVGSCYIVDASPSGAWAGHAGCVAGMTVGGWRFVTPIDGLTALVRSNGLTAVYSAGAWEVGTLCGDRVEIGGQQVVGARGDAIASPAAGSVIDAEARGAVLAILSALRLHGLIAP